MGSLVTAGLSMGSSAGAQVTGGAIGGPQAVINGEGPPGASWAGYLYHEVRSESFYATFGVPQVVCQDRGASLLYGAALQSNRVAVASNLIANCKAGHRVLYQARVVVGVLNSRTHKFDFHYRYTKYRPVPGQRVSIYLSVSNGVAWAHIQDGQMAPALSVSGAGPRSSIEDGAWFAGSNQGVLTVSKSGWADVAVNHIQVPQFKGVGPGAIAKRGRAWLRATTVNRGSFVIERT